MENPSLMVHAVASSLVSSLPITCSVLPLKSLSVAPWTVLTNDYATFYIQCTHVLLVSSSHQRQFVGGSVKIWPTNYIGRKRKRKRKGIKEKGQTSREIALSLGVKRVLSLNSFEHNKDPGNRYPLESHPGNMCGNEYTSLFPRRRSVSFTSPWGERKYPLYLSSLLRNRQD